MPLDVPTIREIERRIVLRLAGNAVPLTDLSAISVTRQLIQAMATPEYAALWRGLAEAHRDWFITTARGDALDRRLADFGLTRPPAVAASGFVTISTSGETIVPAGTVLSTVPGASGDAKRYQVRFNGSPIAADPGDGGWYVNGSRDVEVDAAIPGQAGNTPAASILIAESPITGLVSVSNPLPLVNGVDAASDAEFRQHWLDWLQGLSGGTRGALRRHLVGWRDPVTGRRVHSIAFDEWNGSSLLEANGRSVALVVYVDEGTGGATPSGTTAHPSLVAAVQRRLDGEDSQAAPGLRSAGVPTAAVAAQARLFDASIDLDVDARYDAAFVSAAVRNAIGAYVASLPVAGSSVGGVLSGQVSLARMARVATDVEGVLRADFTNPLGDVSVPIGWRAFLRQLTIKPRTVG